MNNLTRIIGPAPSEFLLDEFIFARLRAERDRVERSLFAFRSGAVPSWDKKKKAAKKKAAKKRAAKAPTALKSAKAIDATLSEHGLTIDDLKALLGGTSSDA